MIEDLKVDLVVDSEGVAEKSLEERIKEHEAEIVRLKKELEPPANPKRDLRYNAPEEEFIFHDGNFVRNEVKFHQSGRDRILAQLEMAASAVWMKNNLPHGYLGVWWRGVTKLSDQWRALVMKLDPHRELILAHLDELEAEDITGVKPLLTWVTETAGKAVVKLQKAKWEEKNAPPEETVVGWCQGLSIDPQYRSPKDMPKHVRQLFYVTRSLKNFPNFREKDRNAITERWLTKEYFNMEAKLKVKNDVKSNFKRRI